MQKKYYNVKEKSASEVDVLLYGIIGDWWSDTPITDVAFVSEFKDLEKKYDRINVRINSPGGSIWDGLPIFNAISQSKNDVHTYNDGIAYSMGAIILQAAQPGKRHAAKNSLTLLHAPLTGIFGNAMHFRTEADNLDKYAESLMSTLEQHTGLSAEKIKTKWFDYNDHLLTASEALTEKLVDVIEEYPAKKPDNIENMAFKDVMNFYMAGSDSEKVGFLDKIKETISNLFNQQKNDQTQTKIEKMNKCIALLAVLAVSDITLVEGKASFSEEELQKIENALNKAADLENQLEAAKNEKQKAEQDLASAKTELQSVKDEFEAFKKADAEEESASKKEKDEIESKSDPYDQANYNQMADKFLK